jgi:hypothetical protein
MYFYIISSLKRRLVNELKDSFSRHPVYEKLTPFIQNKFAFTERPQFGIVVKGSSTNKVQMSADNFLGTIDSHVMLAYVGQPTFPIEWVREDLTCVRKHNGMPTAPGVYYIEILSAPTNASEEGIFVVDPLLTATDEAVLQFTSGVETEAQLQQPPVRKTLRLWENRRFLLKEGEHYDVDYTDGSLKLHGNFTPGAILTADYRYAAPSIGPVKWMWNTSDFTTLPGVVLAFGKRARAGDKVAVVVYPDRVAAAHAYGGRIEVSFDIDVISQDAIQMEEIADLVFMYMWAEKRSALSFEGIELMDVSMGGEAEESYDENADTYYYTASMSMQFQGDWEVHVPLGLTISQVTPTSEGINGIVPGSIFFATNPIVSGRNNDFERIK